MLYVSNRYLFFATSRITVINRHFGLRIPLTRIASLGIEDRTWQGHNGGMRRRVRIALDSGEVHLLVFNHPDKILAELRQLISPR